MKSDGNLPEEERRKFIRRLVGMAGFGAPIIRSFTMTVATGSLLTLSNKASALIVSDPGGGGGGGGNTTGTTFQTTFETTFATTIPTTFETTYATTIPTTFETTYATTIPTTYETTYATTGPTTFMTTRPGGGGGGTVKAPEFDVGSAAAALTVLAGSLLVLADRTAKRPTDQSDET
jgi:hypothetical protein